MFFDQCSRDRCVTMPTRGWGPWSFSTCTVFFPVAGMVTLSILAFQRNENHFQQTTLLVFPHRTLTEINKVSPCNSLCHCNSRKYEPVCGVDQISYFSPCHAGCTVRVKDRKKTPKTNLLDIEQVGTLIYSNSRQSFDRNRTVSENLEICGVIYQVRGMVFRQKHRKWIKKTRPSRVFF